MPTTSRRPNWRVELLMALAIFLITGPVIQVWTAQPASRYLLTVAAADDHSLQLDPYVGVLGIDRALYGGHTYSDKAPYPSLIVVPAYEAFRAMGGKPFPVIEGRQVVNRSTHWGLWWITFWSSTVPAIILAITLRRLLLRFDRSHATAVALAIMLGTTMLPFTTWLFSHAMAALFVGLAWALLRPDRPSRRDVMLAGICLGAGIGSEYTIAIVAFILLIDVLISRHWERAAWLSAGTVLGTVPLLIYNWRVFHNPFEVSYQGHLANFHGSGAFGVFNLTAPKLDEVTRALVGDRGLFVLTPVALFAVIGCFVAITEGGRVRRDGWIALTTLVGFVIATTGIDGLGGSSPGPRYLIPMFPLLSVPLALVWQRFPRPSAAAAAIGGVTMWIATVTTPDIDSKAPNALGTWLDHLRDGDLVTNILTGRQNGWVLYLTATAGVVAALAAVRLSRSDLTTVD